MRNKLTAAGRIRRYGWLPLISIWVSIASAASTNSAWITRVWQSDDGLPNNNVTGLAQTSDNYLWVANPSRLARFDGVRFDDYSSRNVIPGHDQRISTVLAGQHGGLWIAMDHGPVAYLDARGEQIYSNGLPDLIAQGMVQDGDGAVWIAYRSGMISRIKDGQVTQFTTNEIAAGTSCSLATDNRGRLWIAKNGQVGVFRDGKFAPVLILGRTVYTRLARARDGGMWICQDSQLTWCDEQGHRRDVGTFVPENPSTQPNAMIEDHLGAVWIGTSDSGLFRYDGTGFENVPVSHRAVLSLAEDREGNLWVGTDGGGLNRVQPRTVALEGLESGLPFEAVQSICEDTNGVVWAVTQNGLLARRINGHWTTQPENPDWPTSGITCVASDPSGGVWIGTQNRGTLYCWRNGQLTAFLPTDTPFSRIIKAVLPTSTGDVWIGGTGAVALQRLRNGVFTNFPLPSRAAIIRAMAEDTAGNIWIGDNKGMLLRVKGDVLTDETTRYSDVPLSIRCLHTTADGSLWLGYAGNGLGRIKDGHFVRITTAEGLYDDFISEIMSDNRGWLWFGADEGIFKVQQQELENLAAGKVDHVRSIHYGQSAGLPSVQANFGFSPGALRTRDGRVWLPMRSALAIAEPNKLHEDTKPPTVLIKQVIVDDRVVASYDAIKPIQSGIDLENPAAVLKLPPRHWHLEFEFTALSFIAPENVRFRYRLEGIDEGWIEAKAQRSASYSRLPAGHYRFQVTACNSDGVWSDPGTALEFSVTPFVWQTWWFRLTVVVLFTAVVFAVARYVSMRRMRSMLRTIQHQAAVDKSRMAGMAEVAASVLHNIGNVLNSINVSSSLVTRKIRNSKADSLDKVTALLKEHAGDLPGFFTSDPKGRELPGYLSDLSQHLAGEHEDILNELKSLENNIEHITQIVISQQNYAHDAGVQETFNLNEVAEDAIRICTGTAEQRELQITREFQKLPPVTTDKHKVLQILINLIANAKRALSNGGPPEKHLIVRVEMNGANTAKISVIDNGVGIPPENLTQIFQQAFTTGRDGHGLNLHRNALAAGELGGSLVAQSKGPGQGATFTLEFPCQPEKNGSSH